MAVKWSWNKFWIFFEVVAASPSFHQFCLFVFCMTDRGPLLWSTDQKSVSFRPFSTDYIWDRHLKRFVWAPLVFTFTISWKCVLYARKGYYCEGFNSCLETYHVFKPCIFVQFVSNLPKWSFNTVSTIGNGLLINYCKYYITFSIQ